MSQGQGITRELSLGEVVSKTFDYFRRDLVKYVVLFAIVETIIGIVSALIRHAVVLPATPAPGSTAQVFESWAPGFFGSLIALVGLTAIVTLVFYPVIYGSAVKMASTAIQNGQVDLGASVRSVVSKIVWIWIVGIVVGIIVFAGFIALVIPGIILAIMFSLVLPVVILESASFASLGRSRELVSKRWLKTFALFIVFGIIIGIASAVVGVISSPFGVASTVVSSILSAFYLPLIPIFMTVYYYSNVARLSPPQMGPTVITPGGAVVQVGAVKFCPNCGTQLAADAMFCPKCGMKTDVV
jgi:uncharacterized membrane protein YfcA